MKNLFIAIVLIYFVLDGHSQADWLTYYQETVVAIGEIVKAEIKENDTVVVKDAFNLIGTGVCFYVKYDSIILPCLITAKHVFYNSRENWKPNTLMVRFSWFENTSILDYLGTELILEINREKHWFPHPDSTVDLAGIILFPDEFSINNNKVNILRYDTFADSLEYYPGQKVYVFGFPGAVGPEYWTKSILREGIVSWVNAKKPHKVPFLIDCDVFPGNSGGPVLSVPYGISRKGTILDGGNISFMGIVSQRRLGHNLIMDSKGNIIQDIKGTRLVSYESIGVGVVEPAYRVKELLKHIEKEIK